MWPTVRHLSHLNLQHSGQLKVGGLNTCSKTPRSLDRSSGVQGWITSPVLISMPCSRIDSSRNCLNHGSVCIGLSISDLFLMHAAPPWSDLEALDRLDTGDRHPLSVVWMISISEFDDATIRSTAVVLEHGGWSSIDYDLRSKRHRHVFPARKLTTLVSVHRSFLSR